MHARLFTPHLMASAVAVTIARDVASKKQERHESRKERNYKYYY